MNSSSLAQAFNSSIFASTCLTQLNIEMAHSVKSVYYAMLKENITDIFQADEDGVYVLEISYDIDGTTYRNGKVVAMLFPRGENV